MTPAPAPGREGDRERAMWIGIDVMTEDELGDLLGRPWFRRYV
ncbi:hypothetical protein [Streptomyces achromogenes]|nr:hypothetical protein [Streptomyces achromogenes]